MGEPPQRDTGFVCGKASGSGWMYAILVQAGARKLYAVRPDGVVEMADDLTLNEARKVLEQIGLEFAQKPSLPRTGGVVGEESRYCTCPNGDDSAEYGQI